MFFFISLNWRCGPRLERDWVTCHAIHLWRSSSLVFLSIQQQFIYFHNFFFTFMGLQVRCSIVNFFFILTFCYATAAEHYSVSTIIHHAVAKTFFVVQLTYDENHKFVVSFFFSLLILVKEVSADIPPKVIRGCCKKKQLLHILGSCLVTPSRILPKNPFPSSKVFEARSTRQQFAK